MNQLSSLKSAKNISASRRVGRGHGSGKGKTSGRGHKGYKARTGSTSRLRFEGGQMPLLQRIPKLKGFKAVQRIVFKAINVGDIEKYEKNGHLDKKLLQEKKILRRGESLVILGKGEVSKAVSVKAARFSKSAKEKIEKAGGKAIVK